MFKVANETDAVRNLQSIHPTPTVLSKMNATDGNIKLLEKTPDDQEAGHKAGPAGVLISRG
jgi:hypothetical protein